MYFLGTVEEALEPSYSNSHLTRPRLMVGSEEDVLRLGLCVADDHQDYSSRAQGSPRAYLAQP